MKTSTNVLLIIAGILTIGGGTAYVALRPNEANRKAAQENKV